MADTERQATEASGCLSHIRDHYTAMASRDISAADRESMDTRAVKAMNNYIKACILDVSVRSQSASTITVADIGCGRGQDMAKWMYACTAAKKRIRDFYGMDLADMGAASLAYKYISVILDDNVHFSVGDMSKRFEGVPDDSVDVLSCQLAVHYLFESEGMLQGFFAECARVLTHSGVLIMSYVDGRSVVRRCRNAATRDLNDTVVARGKYYSISIDRRHLSARIPNVYGCKYVFSLTDCIEELPEYLAHEGVLRTIGKLHGFTAGTSMYFDEAVRHFMTIPYLQLISMKMKYVGCDNPDAYDTANMYRFNVFSKSTSTLRRWDQCLSSSPETTERRHHPSAGAKP